MFASQHVGLPFSGAWSRAIICVGCLTAAAFVSMITVQASPAAGQWRSVLIDHNIFKICFSLFSNENSLHLPLLLPQLFSRDLKPPEKPREKSGLKSLFSMKTDIDYVALFESGTSHAQLYGTAVAGGIAASGSARAGVASANSAAADARDALILRGEKLSQLSDR
jgi:hypothetical protein